MKERNDRVFKARMPDRLVTDATAAAEQDGVNLSEFVRQAIDAKLADRGRVDLLRIIERLPSRISGDELSQAFKAQEGPARDYASSGEWKARAALANTLLGLAGVHLHGFRNLGGTSSGCNRAKAAALYEEARSLFAGCAVDAESPDDSNWALGMARAAKDERDHAVAPPSGAKRGILFVLPSGLLGGLEAPARPNQAGDSPAGKVRV